MQTYRFYTKKGERLGIFLRERNVGSHIEIYRCSLADQFSKKKARNAFNGIQVIGEEEEYHPQIEMFNKKLTGKEFFAWCKQNFYILSESERKAKYLTLTKIGSKEKILDIKPLFKMNP